MVFWRFFNRLLYLAPSPALNFPFAALILPRLVSFFAFAALFLPRLVSLFAFATLFSATPCLSFAFATSFPQRLVSLLPSQPSFPQRRVSVPFQSSFRRMVKHFRPFLLKPLFCHRSKLSFSPHGQAFLALLSYPCFL